LSTTRCSGLERYHVDGLRVDAVASMLYLDYSAQGGRMDSQQAWRARKLEAVGIPARHEPPRSMAAPGIMTIAEESTAWPGVSRPVHDGGLGFGFKWNMGFMHDTLQYMARDPHPPPPSPQRHHLRPDSMPLPRISCCR
jgi:1,4-alpha-glucan branching enzyme